MRSKVLAALLTTLAAVMLTGCAGWPASFGPSGTTPAIIYTDGQVYPAANTSSTVYNLTTDDFEIKGTVMAQGEADNILGIISRGDNGYQSLLAEARAQGCDDVMNVRMDVTFSNIFVFYSKVNTTLTGQGVKWK